MLCQDLYLSPKIPIKVIGNLSIIGIDSFVQLLGQLSCMGLGYSSSWGAAKPNHGHTFSHSRASVNDIDHSEILAPSSLAVARSGTNFSGASRSNNDLQFSRKKT